MSEYFITHVEPKNLLKGREALFFLREIKEDGSRKSHLVELEIPHHIHTPYLSNKEVIDLSTEMEKEKEFDHLRLIRKTYSRSKGFLIAEGSKEDKLILPEQFICKKKSNEFRDPLDLNSPSRLLRWWYPPMMKVTSPNAIPDNPLHLGKRKFVSIEDIVNDSYAVIDIEVENWQIGKDHIFMVVYASPSQRIIYHDLPFPYFKHNNFKLVQFNSQKDLGQKLSETLHQDDPLWIYGHNIMNFDQMRIRDLTKAYNPSSNKHYPITKASQGLGRVLTKGRWTLDTYTYNFHHRNIRADNKLETVSDIKKSIDYQMQAELVVKARNGDHSAFRMLVEYCIEDGLYSEVEGQKLKQLITEKALHFRCSPDRICATSKLIVADEAWQRRYYMIKGNFRDSWKRERREELFSLDKFKLDLLNDGYKKGFFPKTNVLYLTPFLAGCKDLIEKRSPELLDRIKGSKDTIEKFDLMQTLNAEFSYVIEEAMKIYNLKNDSSNFFSKKQERAFYSLLQSLGLPQMKPIDFYRNIEKAITNTNHALDRYNIINRGPHFYFIEGNPNFERLERTLHGCYLGQGPAISLGKNKIVANPFEEDNLKRFIYQGLRVGHGMKTHFEKRVMWTVLEKIFAGEDLSNVKNYLNSEIKQFSEGKKNRESYFLKRKRRTYNKRLLNEVLRDLVGQEIHASYKNIYARINDRFSDETKKELQEIVDRCRDNYSYPFIIDLMDGIENPFPPKINLVYALDGPKDPLPEKAVFELDYQRYGQKAKEFLKEIYEILEPEQLELGL